MRASEVVRRGSDYLERHHVDQPCATAEALLASILGTDRIGLYLREVELSPEEAKRFGRLLCRRCAGTPVQHLTGEQAFRRLILTAREGVFIPRPETEIVVDVALATIEGISQPVVVDVGTGTGAIALSIALEHPGAHVTAIDSSADAVALTREHAARFGLDLDVREGDLLQPVTPELAEAVDLVVSNPPYVEPERLAALPLDVRGDPTDALVGGIEIYRRLFSQATTLLRAGGAVVVEVGDDQSDGVASAARAANFLDVRTHPDLTGRSRVVVGRRP